MNDKTLNMKMPSELYEKLQNEAESKNISVASLIRLILSEHFQKDVKK